MWNLSSQEFKSFTNFLDLLYRQMEHLRMVISSLRVLLSPREIFFMLFYQFVEPRVVNVQVRQFLMNFGNVAIKGCMEKKAVV